MTKYIDADRLRAEINSFMNPDEEWKHLTQEELSFMERCKSYVFSVIDSLQQEQPDKETILRICKLHKIWSIMAPWENVEDFVITNWNSKI